jgi:hypothetical protein
VEPVVPEEKWKTYEEVALHLLKRFAEHFGVGRFESKQLVAGDSGTEWEIDAKGCAADGSYFIIVECKRHTKTRISQAITGGLAWSIRDAGASGGILVSPLGFQEGAKKVANNSGIVEVRLDQNSTTTDFVLCFLNKVCIGFSDTGKLIETMTAIVKDKDGNIIES